MIEMLGVLAIVGVLSAGGIAGYSMAMQSYKTNQLIEKINLIASRVRTLYKSGVYTELGSDGEGAQILINSGKIADLSNPFGGDLGVGKAADNMFFIIGRNIPAETCTDIFQTDWGGSGVFDKIIINNSYTFSYGAGTYPVSDMATIVDVCKGGNNKVRLDFK